MKKLLLALFILLMAFNPIFGAGQEDFIAAISGEKYDLVKKMIEEGMNVNTDTNGRWPIHTAVFSGNVAMTKLLLDNGAKVDQRDNLDATPLITATGMFGKLAMVKLLVERGADINSHDSFGETPMLNAAGNENYALVKYLLQKGARVITSQCDSAISRAAARGMLKNVKIIVSQFRQIIDHKNKKGESALHSAVESGNYHTYRYLLSQGAKSTFVDNDGNNLLITAVLGGSYSIVQDLLRKGFNPNFQNNQGETALMKATFSGNFSLVQLLIEHGASVNIRGKSSVDTAIYWAIIGRTTNVRMLRLLAKHANNENRKNAILIALHHNKPEASKIFFRYLDNADRAKFRHEAVMLSARLGYLAQLKSYSFGANLNATNEEGNTPLMLAAKHGNIETLKYLISKKVKLESRDNLGRSAATLAAQAYELDILKALKMSGATLNSLDNKKQTILMQVVGIFAPSFHLRAKGKLMLEYLIRENNINAQDEAGESALMKAVRANNVSMVRQLIEACASLTLENKQSLDVKAVAYHDAPTMTEHLYPPSNPACRSGTAVQVRPTIW